MNTAARFGLDHESIAATTVAFRSRSTPRCIRRTRLAPMDTSRDLPFYDTQPSRTEAYSPAFLERLLPFVAPLYHWYFRCEIRGIERLGAPGAFLVANHNAMGLVEVPLLIYGWHRCFGSSRQGRGLTHNWLFRVPILRTLLARVGCVPATPVVAERTLRAGIDLLVFPGGDREAARPWSRRGEVTLAGRTGFVRVALRTGAPVVPLVICGAHETVPIFSSGARLARLLRLDTLLSVKVVPMTLQTFLLVWKIVDVLAGNSTPLTLPLYLLNFFVLLPWLPSKIVMEFLDPIDLRAETAGAPTEEDKLRLGLELVTSRMQARMDELQMARRTPWG
jgi:1-acyl-sn-glycerol-3-phosphate acyltransferase